MTVAKVGSFLRHGAEWEGRKWPNVAASHLSAQHLREEAAQPASRGASWRFSTLESVCPRRHTCSVLKLHTPCPPRLSSALRAGSGLRGTGGASLRMWTRTRTSSCSRLATLAPSCCRSFASPLGSLSRDRESARGRHLSVGRRPREKRLPARRDRGRLSRSKIGQRRSS